MHTPEPTSPLSRRLNADWHRLLADRQVRRRLADQPLAGHTDLASLLAATGHDRSVPMPLADAVLAEVIRVASTDDLAARVALQRVLPGLVSIANRRAQRRPERRQEVFEELAASAWLVIRTYPLERRPAKIAVNVLRDAEYHLFVRPARLRSAAEVVTDLVEHLDARHAGIDGRPGLREAAAEVQVAELLDLAGEAGLSDGDVALLREVYMEGRPLREVAERRGCTVRTVYNRREAATRRLGSVAVAA